MFPKRQKLTNAGTHRWSLIGLKILPIKKNRSLSNLAISEDLLKKSINYAKSFSTIKENDISAIRLALKSLLFSKDGTWVKKSGNKLFDVTITSFNGA